MTTTSHTSLSFMMAFVETAINHLTSCHIDISLKSIIVGLVSRQQVTFVQSVCRYLILTDMLINHNVNNWLARTSSATWLDLLSLQHVTRRQNHYRHWAMINGFNQWMPLKDYGCWPLSSSFLDRWESLLTQILATLCHNAIIDPQLV